MFDKRTRYKQVCQLLLSLLQRGPNPLSGILIPRPPGDNHNKPPYFFVLFFVCFFNLFIFIFIAFYFLFCCFFCFCFFFVCFWFFCFSFVFFLCFFLCFFFVLLFFFFFFFIKSPGYREVLILSLGS